MSNKAFSNNGYERGITATSKEIGELTEQGVRGWTKTETTRRAHERLDNLAVGETATFEIPNRHVADNGGRTLYAARRVA